MPDGPRHSCPLCGKTWPCQAFRYGYACRYSPALPCPQCARGGK